jgi:hypothetical protein
MSCRRRHPCQVRNRNAQVSRAVGRDAKGGCVPLRNDDLRGRVTSITGFDCHWKIPVVTVPRWKFRHCSIPRVPDPAPTIQRNSRLLPVRALGRTECVLNVIRCLVRIQKDWSTLRPGNGYGRPVRNRWTTLIFTDTTPQLNPEIACCWQPNEIHGEQNQKPEYDERDVILAMFYEPPEIA